MTDRSQTTEMQDLPRALNGAAYALEMCASVHDAETMIPDALAKAAVIAYLNLTGREAEAEAVSNVAI